MEETIVDLKPVKKVFSKIGLALSAILLLATAAQLALMLVPKLIWGENILINSSWGKWFISFAPLYLIAIPGGLLILRQLPAQTPADQKLGGKRFWVILPICFCLMYGGNLIGNLLSMLLSGGNAQNAIVNYAMDTNPLKILVMVILAPLLEEFVFRKQIIDRTARYGEKTAVVLSALTFGLIHQNLFQFFYAFGLGLIFGYIYIRTGRLRYPVVLHSIINFMGAVVAPWIMTVVDLDALSNIDPNASTEQIMALYGEILPGLVIYLGYAFLLMQTALVGLVLLIIKFKKAQWQEAEEQLPPGTAAKTVYLNPGMVLFVVLCLAAFVWALL